MITSGRPTIGLRRINLPVLIVLGLAVLLLCGIAGAGTARADTTGSPPTPPATTQFVDPTPPTSGSSVSATPVEAPSPPSGPVLPRADDGGDCGLLDFVCPVVQGIDRWFKDLVISALSPVVDLISRTALTTPDVTTVPQVSELWAVTRWIANTIFVLFVVAGGYVVAAHETLQTRYALREVAPRIAVGAIAVNLSLVVIGQAIAAVNAISTAVLGQDEMGSVTTGIKAQVTDLVNHGAVFVIFIALVLLVLAVILLALYVVRVAMTVIVVVAGPLALVCHASPYSEGIAKLWWRALIGVLGIQVFQAITLIVFLKVLFQQDSAHPSALLGPANGLMNLIICCVLLALLIKIPGWVMRQVGLGGRSAIASVIKFALLAKGLGMIGLGTKGTAGRLLSVRGGGTRRGPGPGGRPPAAGPAAPDPPGPSGPLPGGGKAPATDDTGAPSDREARRAAKQRAATDRAREAAIRAWSAPHGRSDRISEEPGPISATPPSSASTPDRISTPTQSTSRPATSTASPPKKQSTRPQAGRMPEPAREPVPRATSPRPSPIPTPPLDHTRRAKQPQLVRISQPPLPMSAPAPRVSTPTAPDRTPGRISSEPPRISQTPPFTGHMQPAPGTEPSPGTHRVRERSARRQPNKPIPGVQATPQPRPRSKGGS